MSPAPSGDHGRIAADAARLADDWAAFSENGRLVLHTLGLNEDQTLQRMLTDSVTPLHEIEPGLFLGDEKAACDLSWLRSLNITHVVNCLTPGFEFFSGRTLLADGLPALQYLTLDLQDDNREDIYPRFSPASEWIHAALEHSAVVSPESSSASSSSAAPAPTPPRGGGVLVHCSMGISRSAAILTAYLMARHRISAPVALARIQRVRSCADPRPRFRHDLLSWQLALGIPHDLAELRQLEALMPAAAARLHAHDREQDRVGQGQGTGDAVGGLGDLEHAAPASHHPTLAEAGHRLSKNHMYGHAGDHGSEDSEHSSGSAGGAGHADAHAPPPAQAQARRNSLLAASHGSISFRGLDALRAGRSARSSRRLSVSMPATPMEGAAPHAPGAVEVTAASGSAPTDSDGASSYIIVGKAAAPAVDVAGPGTKPDADSAREDEGATIEEFQAALARVGIERAAARAALDRGEGEVFEAEDYDYAWKMRPRPPVGVRGMPAASPSSPSVSTSTSTSTGSRNVMIAVARFGSGPGGAKLSGAAAAAALLSVSGGLSGVNVEQPPAVPLAIPRPGSAVSASTRGFAPGGSASSGSASSSDTSASASGSAAVSRRGSNRTALSVAASAAARGRVSSISDDEDTTAWDAAASAVPFLAPVAPVSLGAGNSSNAATASVSAAGCVSLYSANSAGPSLRAPALGLGGTQTSAATATVTHDDATCLLQPEAATTGEAASAAAAQLAEASSPLGRIGAPLAVTLPAASADFGTGSAAAIAAVIGARRAPPLMVYRGSSTPRTGSGAGAGQGHGAVSASGSGSAGSGTPASVWAISGGSGRSSVGRSFSGPTSAEAAAFASSLAAAAGEPSHTDGTPVSVSRTSSAPLSRSGVSHSGMGTGMGIGMEMSMGLSLALPSPTAGGVLPGRALASSASAAASPAAQCRLGAVQLASPSTAATEHTFSSSAPAKAVAESGGTDSAALAASSTSCTASAAVTVAGAATWFLGAGVAASSGQKGIPQAASSALGICAAAVLAPGAGASVCLPSASAARGESSASISPPRSE